MFPALPRFAGTKCAGSFASHVIAHAAASTVRSNTSVETFKIRFVTALSSQPSFRCMIVSATKLSCLNLMPTHACRAADALGPIQREGKGWLEALLLSGLRTNSGASWASAKEEALTYANTRLLNSAALPAKWELAATSALSRPPRS
jgi:hypothetical protein